MRQTRGDKNAHWIEMFCLVPRGPDKGERVVLTQAQRETVRMIYDNPSGPQDVPSLDHWRLTWRCCIYAGRKPCSMISGRCDSRHLHGLGQCWPRFASRVEARW
jgi:hypothetical protein